jgi:hypothetical protein
LRILTITRFWAFGGFMPSYPQIIAIGHRIGIVCRSLTSVNLKLFNNSRGLSAGEVQKRGFSLLFHGVCVTFLSVQNKLRMLTIPDCRNRRMEDLIMNGNSYQIKSMCSLVAVCVL